MKVLFAVLTWAFLTFGANAAQFNEGKQYILLSKTVPDAPEVMEFFRSTARIAISLNRSFMSQTKSLKNYRQRRG